MSDERVAVAVVGGGQAGLAVAYHLGRAGLDHLVLERTPRIGDVWRSRWDSLRLFTAAHSDGLPGMRFPAEPRSYPTKDQMADYLESYVAAFSLQVRPGAAVDRLSKPDALFHLRVGARLIQADQVVIATGGYQSPRIPALAAGLDPEICQLHAAEYRRPEQLREGETLVVGAGNSGAEIAIEVAQAGHRTWLAGRPTGRIPGPLWAWDGRLFWLLANRVTSVRTPIGRRVRRQVLARGGPLVRHSMADVRRARVELVNRVAGTRDGRPLLEDGRLLEVTNVIWCTGFGHDFRWIDLPVFGPDGAPRHDRGVVSSLPGLYFIGLPFLSKLGSALIGGVGGDASRLAQVIAAARA